MAHGRFLLFKEYIMGVNVLGINVTELACVHVMVMHDLQVHSSANLCFTYVIEKSENKHE